METERPDLQPAVSVSASVPAGGAGKIRKYRKEEFVCNTEKEEERCISLRLSTSILQPVVEQDGQRRQEGDQGDKGEGQDGGGGQEEGEV